jgi:hypothetical protein
MFVINRQEVGGSSIKYASRFLFVSRGVWDDINKDDKMKYLLKLKENLLLMLTYQ